MIYGVVFIPHPGDRHKLLQDSQFGVRAPLVYESAAKASEGVWKPMVSRGGFTMQRIGIPLAWDRSAFGHAIDWVERLTRKQLPASGVAWALVGREVEGTDRDKELAEQMRLACQREYIDTVKPFGTLVLLGVNYKVLIQETT